MKKRPVPKGQKMPSQISAGQYGPEYRSPQAVPWMEADGVAYLKASHNRAMTIKDQREAYAEQNRNLKNWAEYQGGGTFRYSKIKRPVN